MLVDVEESVRAQQQRVTYLDPAQNDEKLRLMKLLESQREQEEWEVALGESGSVEGTFGAREQSVDVAKAGGGGKRPRPRRTGTRRSARSSGA